jgi:hypothetical protein
MWLIPAGFIFACLTIGIGGRIRVLHLVLISLLLYIGLMLFLALSGTLLVGIYYYPLSLAAVIEAWDSFQLFVNAFIPFLMVLSDIAFILRMMTGDTSILAVFLEFLVASLFIGIIGLVITGVSGHFTRGSGLHVVTAPEPAVEVPSYDEPSAQPPLAIDTAPAYVPAQSTPAPAPPATMDAPPPMPAPRPVEDAPPPPPPSKGGSPSAQAISSLKGKVKKHLKGTGRKAPAGQSRCPHCNATVIRGSAYCNACEKAI